MDCGTGGPAGVSNDHTLRIYESILGLLSSEENPTPLVRLNKVVPLNKTKVFAKLEWYNPFGAVKDRVASNLVQAAESNGNLGRGNRLVEPTSGNTGLGLAMIGNAKGYPLKTPLSQAIPLEKRAILRFLGCDVVELDDTLCPAPGAPEGAIAMAMDTAKKEPDFRLLNQYENEANPLAHYKTTGPEIWKQTQGKVTHIIAGLGTCGTISGTGKFLKEKNPKIQIIGVHPVEGHDIPGVRSIIQLKQTRFFRREEYTHLVEVKDEEAYEMCLRLNREESIIAGPSSGMALAGALKVVQDQPNAVAVVIFPDNIFKYSSSLLRHFPDLFSGLKKDGASSAPGVLPVTPVTPVVQPSPADTIEPEDALQLMQSNQRALFIDVRDEVSFQSVHVIGSVNIPLATLGESIGNITTDHDIPVVLLCNRGKISIPGAAALKALGFKNAKSLAGGISAWSEKGYPIKR